MRFLFRLHGFVPVCCFLALAVFAAAPLRAQKASDARKPVINKAGAPVTEEITELPTMEIMDRADLPPPERWNYVKIPGFEVLSNASERRIKKLLVDFEMYRIALNEAWPIKVKTPRPAALIFCARNSFDQFVPQSTRTDLTTDAGRASMTLIGPERVFIVLDLGTPTLSLSGVDMDIDMSSFGATFEVDYFQLLYREYVHYLLSQSETPPPPWYEEGVLQILMKLDVYPKYFRLAELRSVPRSSGATSRKNALGIPVPTMPAIEGDGEDSEDSEDGTIAGMETIPDEDFNVALRRRRLLGFNEFFGVKADSPLTRNPIGNNVWAKQCYAFVHMCMFGWPNKYKKQLETFVARSAKEPVTEQLFTECFGKSYKKLLIELRGYIEMPAYQARDFITQGKDRIDGPPRELTPAPEGLSARIRGDALLLAGNPQAAIPALHAAYVRGERDPDFLATYGLAAKAANLDDRAHRMLAQAVKAKTRRASAYTAYAKLLLDDAIANPADADHKRITAEQLSQVLEPLFEARKLPPTQRETYELIAAAWLRSAATPKPTHFSVLSEGLVLFPRDTALVYDCARLTMRMNDTKATGALIGLGLKFAADDPAREKFDQLKAGLAAMPPAPAEPAAAAPASAPPPQDSAVK